MLEADNLIGKTFQSYTLTVKLTSNPTSSIYLGEKGPGVGPKESLVFTYMHAYTLKEQTEQSRFGADIQRLQQLNHPHILPIMLYGLDEEVPYIATQFITWRTLQTRIRRNEVQAFSMSESLHILTQIGQALHYAHQRAIVHGALSPHNILFNLAGEALLTGFSFPTLSYAKSALSAKKEAEEPCLAPEQRNGPPLPASDQYALGCLAYLLFTGHWPLALLAERDQPKKRKLLSPSVYHPALSENLAQVILKALKFEPEERYGSVAEFLEALSATQEIVQSEIPTYAPSLVSVPLAFEHETTAPTVLFPARSSFTLPAPPSLSAAPTITLPETFLSSASLSEPALLPEMSPYKAKARKRRFFGWRVALLALLALLVLSAGTYGLISHSQVGMVSAHTSATSTNQTQTGVPGTNSLPATATSKGTRTASPGAVNTATTIVPTSTTQASPIATSTAAPGAVNTATTTVPTSTAQASPTAPAPTVGGSNSNVTATGVVATSKTYYMKEVVTYSSPVSITAMTIIITVQKTTGVTYNGVYTTSADVATTYSDNGSTIVYKYTLDSGQILSPQKRQAGASFHLTGTAHSTANDQWSITTTSGGATGTASGHF